MTAGPTTLAAPSLRPSVLAVLATAGAALLFVVFLALGTWQVERRAWKLDLIERIEQRVHAPATEAPGPARWRHVSKAEHEYRHVRVKGRFLHDREALVQAVTELGGGFWVVTPLRMPDGHVVLVNRGFVPPEARDAAARAPAPEGEITVTGLLRMTEPDGGFLRTNDAAAERWYSRDVQAIAASRGLDRVAPYFIDAGAAAPTQANSAAAPVERQWPAGGLTVIRFNNHHLVYAITWYALALMVAGGAWYVAREAQGLGRRRTGDNGD